MTTSKLYPLAAIFQAAQLALQLSTRGHCEDIFLKAQIDSLFVFDPTHTEQIYQDQFRHLKLGLVSLELALKEPHKTLKGVMSKMVVSFFKLAKFILATPNAQKKIRTQLDRIHKQIQYFSDWQHPRVMENLSLLYLDIANSRHLRLKIVGQKKHLQDLALLNKIRAVLFSGARAAVLWYQLGGNIFWLVWHRKTLLKEIESILNTF